MQDRDAALSLFLGPLTPQGSEVVPPPYSHSHTNTHWRQITQWPWNSSSLLLLFRPDSIHLCCQAWIWDLASRPCSCEIWVTMVGLLKGCSGGTHVFQRAGLMTEKLMIKHVHDLCVVNFLCRLVFPRDPFDWLTKKVTIFVRFALFLVKYCYILLLKDTWRSQELKINQKNVNVNLWFMAVHQAPF